MTQFFDELMTMWEKITDEHIEWQNKGESISIREHFSYIQRLVKQGDGFLECQTYGF